MGFDSVKLNKIMITIEILLFFTIAILLLLDLQNNSTAISIFVYAAFMSVTLIRMAYHFWRIRKLEKKE